MPVILVLIMYTYVQNIITTNFFMYKAFYEGGIKEKTYFIIGNPS